MSAYHTADMTHAGRTFRVEHHSDDTMGAPWEEHDGHGEVSGWTTRDKLPGELVLNTDGRSRRYYDYAGACRLARADRWDTPPYGTGTPGQRAARAARADFERLRDWCLDRWHWCGVVVVLLDRDGGEIDRASLWGIESDAGAYLEEVAAELAAELTQTAAAWEAGRRAEVHAINRRALALIREIKAAGREFSPAICQALRAQLAGYLRDRAAAFRELESLAAESVR